MVGVAQLVEPRIVIPVVVGSSPIVHPIVSGIEFWPVLRLTESERLHRSVTTECAKRLSVCEFISQKAQVNSGRSPMFTAERKKNFSVMDGRTREARKRLRIHFANSAGEFGQEPDVHHIQRAVSSIGRAGDS